MGQLRPDFGHEGKFRDVAWRGSPPGRCGCTGVTLTTWTWLLAAVPSPTGAARGGAQPPPIPLAVIDDPAQLKRLAAQGAWPVTLGN